MIGSCVIRSRLDTMDYSSHYSRLIERARPRGLKKPSRSDESYVYYESHHVIPRCLYGSDDPSNMVLLTPQEHYVAHLLLMKMHPNIKSLVYAAQMMIVGGSRNNKLHGWLRTKSSRMISEDFERAKKIGRTLTGRVVPEHVGRKISQSNIGRQTSELTRAKISVSTKGKPKSIEHREKIKAALSGKKHSESHITNLIKSKRRNGTLGHSSTAKRKISNILSQLRWFNDGSVNIRIAGDPPEGFKSGRLKMMRKRNTSDQE